MHNPFWNNKTLAWQKLNGATVEVDDELSTQHEEELIIIVVLVPMVFPCITPRRTTESFTLQSV
jgi:hypothetical protein